MQKTRQEHDSLGTIEVPKDALYGAQTMRALQNFRVSERTQNPSLIRAYLRIKAAAAISNLSCGTLSEPVATLIERATDELLRLPVHKWPEIFPVDPYQAGAGTSQNMNVNEVVANLANRIAGRAIGSYSPVHPNDHVNRSQSTNDTFPTAIRLSLIELSLGVINELRKLSETLRKKGDEWHPILKSARTHLQDAVPIRLGHEFRAYAKTISRCANWITQARDELKQLGIGGSAAGTGLTVPAGFQNRIITELSRLTGENLTASEDLREAMQSQSPVTYYSSSLRIAALELTRICNDLRLLASGPMTGLGELILPAVQPGSSIMPGKVNPSILEMCNQAWFAVLGFDQTVAYAAQAGQLELNVMTPIMAHASIEASVVMENALRTLREKCIEGIQPDETRLRRYFESTPQVATALTPRLGYEATAKLVQESLAVGKSVIELVRERKLLSEEELASLLDSRTLAG